MRSSLVLVMLVSATATGVCACTSNDACPADEYCYSCFNEPGQCKPRLARGQQCDGWTPCTSACAQDLVCQPHYQKPGTPPISDVPGTCCDPVTCPPCEVEATRVFDEQQCLVRCTCAKARRNLEDEIVAETCGANMTYSACATACPATCETPAPEMCAAACNPGCTCDAGLVLHNGTCIAPAECPTNSATTSTAAASSSTTASSTPAAATTTAMTPEGSGEEPDTNSTSNTTGPLMGGRKPVDTTDPAATSAALCAVSELNARSNSLFQMQLVRLVSGTQQLVAGTRYALVFDAALSTVCRNTGNTPNLTACPVGSNSVARYTAEVLIQPWMSPSCSVLSPAALASTGAGANETTATPTTAGAAPTNEFAADSRGARDRFANHVLIIGLVAMVALVLGGALLVRLSRSRDAAAAPDAPAQEMAMRDNMNISLLNDD